MAKKSAYARAGVDIAKGDAFVTGISSLVKSTHNKNVTKVPSGYAGLFKLGSAQYLAATTDGVGTKLKLAFELKKHDTVGIDLVAMSVNDLVCVGATPLFFLDYFATGKLDLRISTAVIKGISQGCRESGIALIGGETAEMPGFYEKNEYDLGGFAVGLVDKKDLLDGRRIKTGDFILGLESSGIHSNGYSLVRKLFGRRSKKERQFMARCLAPTRLYVNAAKALRKLGPQLKGLAHITGSGFLNVPRLHEGYDYQFDVVSPGVPPLFEELKSRGGLDWEEMYTTFNMGVGMMVVIEPSAITRAMALLKAAGYKSSLIGLVGPKVRKGSSRVRVSGKDFRVELKY